MPQRLLEVAPRRNVEIPPVKVGDEFEIEISGITQGLDAVGRYQGFTVFVPGGVPGDILRAKVKAVKKDYARAEILEVVTPSPDRVKPQCPLFPRCGGCQWQMIRYEAQLKFKRKIIIDALERIGGFQRSRHDENGQHGQRNQDGGHSQQGQDGHWGRQSEHARRLPMPLVRETIASKARWYYRTKAQVPVGPVKSKGRHASFVAGFYGMGTHEIVDMEECAIQHPISNRAIQVTRSVASVWGLTPYDESTGRGFLRHIVTRVAPSTGQAMVVLVTAKAAFKQGELIGREIMSRFEAVRGVSQNVNTKKTNVILGPTTKLLAGASRIEEVLGGLTFEISPTSFFQVNPPMAEVLYEKVCDYAGLEHGDTAIDAYCGIGGIALFLARGGARVIGIEESREAVKDASRNAARNGLQNVLFEAGTVEEVLAKPDLYAMIKPRVIVVDPPRTGCAESVLRAFVELAPRSIIYVSCYPATLARDLKFLAERGFLPTEVTPVDLFPQTGHVECVVNLERKRRI
ncbi:MAG TPA: 23S rRNA (uracil(1939)-C(5))-methyltransferase RlmD [Clostridia bacterium]|nr:23S rRNA (uracil(1939)-C(5))-methyltransferase RlmD [Clostridia bacterium]